MNGPVTANCSNGSSAHVKKPSKQYGFTITELMIAMALGLILLTGMISVFTGSQRSSSFNTALSDMQESARYALDAIIRDTRMAGFQGCIDINSMSAVVRGDDAPTDDLFNSVVTGSVIAASGNWSPAPPLTFQVPTGIVQPVPGTHTLALQFGSSVTTNLSAAMADVSAPLAAPIPVQSDAGIQSGDLAIIADCDAADLFRVTSAPSGGGFITHAAADNNNNANLSRAYGVGSSLNEARVMKFHSNVYFVGRTDETNDRGDEIRSLYVQTLPYDDSNPPTELVQGIENMRIRFGIRQNNGSLAYFTADDAGYDTSRIESLQLGILMASTDHIRNEEDSQTYTLAGQSIASSSGTVNDGFSHSENKQYRLVFNTTVKVRNRRNREI